MSYSRIPSPFAFSLFFLLLPLSAIAFQNPCKQMQRDLDREIDDLKSHHKLDLMSCNQTSGLDSADCMNLKAAQAQELESLRDRRTRLRAGCRNYVARGAVSGIPADDEFVNTYVNYPNCVGYSCEEYRRKHPHHHYPPGKHPKNPPVTQPGGGGGAGQIKTAQKPGENPGGRQSTKQDKPPHQDSFQSTHHAPVRDTSSAHQRGETHDAQSQNHGSGSSSSTAHSGGSSTSHSGGSATNSNPGAGNSSSTSSASHSSPASSSSSSSAPAQSNSGSSSAGAGNSAPSSHQDSGASRPK